LNYEKLILSNSLTGKCRGEAWEENRSLQTSEKGEGGTVVEARLGRGQGLLGSAWKIKRGEVDTGGNRTVAETDYVWLSGYGGEGDEWTGFKPPS